LASGRHRHLHIADRVAQFRLRRQQSLDGFEAARNPLRVVEPIDAEHDPAAASFAPDGRVRNAKLAQAIVVNHHLPSQDLAVLVDVGVDYASDFDRVEQVVVGVARETMAEVTGSLARRITVKLTLDSARV